MWQVNKHLGNSPAALVSLISQPLIHPPVLCARRGLSMAHRYTNRLVHEKSPYLLQHAHNPVNWYVDNWSGLMLSWEVVVVGVRKARQV